MTELDWEGNSHNFNFRGSIVSASLREGLGGNTKQRWNVFTVMVLPYFYNKISGVRLPICPVIKNKVLMPIKI